MSKRLIKSTSIVVIMTMISRVFGFIRDVVTASFFGAGAQFDAFSIAFRIPNFMRRLFAEGSFSQAFVPILSTYQKQKNATELRAFLNAMAGTLGIALFIVTILGILAAPLIVKLFAPGFVLKDTERYDLAVSMLRITFPYLAFISLTAFSGAILNTYSRFWVAAFTPILLNICMISAAIWFSPWAQVPIKALAWGVFVAGILQLLFQLPFLKSMQLFPRPVFNLKDAGVRRVLKLMVPALFGVSVGQINLLIDSIFASLLVVGSISWLYYSDRLMEFPLGVFGVAISTVILPHLSRHYATSSNESFSLTIDWATRIVLLVALPAAIVLGMLSGPMLSTLLQHGIFDGYDVSMAKQSLSAFAIGILPFMLVKVFAAGFYAKQDMKTPVKIAVLAMVTNILLNLCLIWPLRHAGIALSTSLAAILNASCLFYFLLKRGLYVPRFGFKLFASRIILANGLVMLWIYFATAETNVWIQASNLWRIEHLAFILIMSMLIYIVGLLITGLRPAHLMIPEREAAL